MSHILLVEDEEHLATGIKFNLEAEGHDVTHAADGQAALNRVEKRTSGGPGNSGLDAAGHERLFRLRSDPGIWLRNARVDAQRADTRRGPYARV